MPSTRPLLLCLTLAGCGVPERPQAVDTGPWIGDVSSDVVVDHETSDRSDPAEVPMAQMTGFSFVRDGVAGMPYPRSDDFAYLASEGITLVVTLTEEPLVASELEAHGLDSLHLPIEDFHAPTLDQQIELTRELRARQEAGEYVAIHCLAGLGRTGTMLSTWLVAEGFSADDAIEEIRRLRPGSVETGEQEDAVRRFEMAMEDR